MALALQSQAAVAPATPAVAVIEEKPPVRHRFEALRDEMLALLKTAGRIADAVRDNGTIAMPVILEQPDPETGPFRLKGFYEHFTRQDGNRFIHCQFAYRDPAGGETVDPNAQHHLQVLTGRALAFNLYCQRAELDQALAVALQSPVVPAMIDAILVPAAFFAAYFDNLWKSQTSAPDLLEHRTNLDQHLLMAEDKMLAPSTLAKLLPTRHWPFVGHQIEVAAHAGDYFINGVYFSAGDARTLLAANASPAA